MRFFKSIFLFLLMFHFVQCGAFESGNYYATVEVEGLDGELILNLLDYSDDQIDTITIDEDGTYSFDETIDEYDSYSVSISSSPSEQTCSVVNPEGSFFSGLSHPHVYCDSESAIVSIIVSGLEGNNVLHLNLNDVEELEASNGESTFETELAIGTPYEISYDELPNNQRCTITGDDSNDSGVTEDVTITYECFKVNFLFYAGLHHANLGGREGADTICQDYADDRTETLSCSGDIVAFLSVSADDQIADFADDYNFNTEMPIYDWWGANVVKLADNWDDLLDGEVEGTLYPGWWTGSNADGTFAGASCEGWTSTESAEVNIGIREMDEDWLASTGNCVEREAMYCLCGQEVSTFSLGGTVDGLSGSITLSLNDDEQTVEIEEDGSFTFSEELESGTSYAVTISESPSDETCQISNATGTITTNLTNISIECEFDRSYLFLSESNVAADFGGRSGADQICEDSYSESELGVKCLGGIRAFLTVDGDDQIIDMPESFSIDEDHAVYNADTNEVMGIDWADILDGTVVNGIGQNWWSGSTDQGNDSLQSCEGWTETSNNLAFHGTADATDEMWIFNGVLTCNDQARILCLCHQ